MVLLGKELTYSMKLICTLSILFTLAFISCKDKNCYRDLTVQEMRGLVYNDGERIIFKSNTGLIDTAIAKNYSEEKIESSEDCKDYGIRYRRSLNFSTSLHDSIFVDLYYHRPNARFGLDIEKPDVKNTTFIYPTISFYSPFQFNENQKGTYTINNKQVNSVYKIDSQMNIPESKVNTIYYSYDYGLLRIDLKNGDYLERINF